MNRTPTVDHTELITETAGAGGDGGRAAQGATVHRGKTWEQDEAGAPGRDPGRGWFLTLPLASAHPWRVPGPDRGSPSGHSRCFRHGAAVGVRGAGERGALSKQCKHSESLLPLQVTITDETGEELTCRWVERMSKCQITNRTGSRTGMTFITAHASGSRLGMNRGVVYLLPSTMD